MTMKVPLSDIDITKEEYTAINEVLKSRWLSMGQQTQQFESAFAEFIQVKHAFAVANGTAALHIAYQALGLGQGDEVICPGLTFVATANAVIYTGAKPVFADITSEDDWNISPESIENRITPRTKAIAVMHYAGYPCDMKRIMQIAKKHNLYVVEDAAHAPGVDCNGRKLGTIGTIGCFSFFSNKNMTTGEGGMVVTGDDTLAEKVRRIRSHGMDRLSWDKQSGHAYAYDVTELGFNYRIDEIRASIGLVQLKKLPKNNSIRKELTYLYREKLDLVPGISVPFRSYKKEASYHIFPILLDLKCNRKKFMEALNKEGIQTSMHYPPLHLFRYYRERFGYAEGMLPITEAVCRKEVTLPLYPTMGTEAVEYVVSAVDSFMKKEEGR